MRSTGDLFEKPTTYTVVYGTLDLLPDDGPGIYNRPPKAGCGHPLGKQWWIWEGDVLNDQGINAPLAVICLDCGCGVPEIGKNPAPVPSRDECEKLMRTDIMAHRDRMPPWTIHRTLRYLFGRRAYLRPANYYRGKSCPSRALARLRSQPKGTPTALSTARRLRAEGRLYPWTQFPKSLRRLETAIIGLSTAPCEVGYGFRRRPPAWMWGA